jgi:hypothetical protein
MIQRRLSFKAPPPPVPTIVLPTTTKQEVKLALHQATVIIRTDVVVFRPKHFPFHFTVMGVEHVIDPTLTVEGIRMWCELHNKRVYLSGDYLVDPNAPFALPGAGLDLGRGEVGENPVFTVEWTDSHVNVSRHTILVDVSKHPQRRVSLGRESMNVPGEPRRRSIYSLKS